MNSAVHVAIPRASFPSWSVPAYETHGEHASISEVSSYAKNLLRDLGNASSEGFHQREMHITYGQFAATLPMELGFRLGVPLIRDVWSTSDSLPEWIARVLQLCHDDRHDAALKEISLATGRLKAKGQFMQLSTDLKRFDLKKLPDVVLVSLLRNTYSIRSQVSCWKFLLDKTEQLLRERKREPRFLLRGLKSYS